MAIEKINDLGSINIAPEAIASLAGSVVAECYGVVGFIALIGNRRKHEA